MFKYAIISIIILIIIIVSISLTITSVWWAFLIPVMALGAFAKIKRWPLKYFLTGFLAGSCTWSLAYLFYHINGQNSILTRNGEIPLLVVVIITGIIGGLLTGLSFYTGSCLYNNQHSDLDA